MREATVFTIWSRKAPGPYLTRVLLGPLRLHIFHRGDLDPDPHDHPADFWTFPLVSYVEEFRTADGFTETRVVRAFRLHHRTAEFAHRVIGPACDRGEQVATLVLWGRRRRDWGFHTSDGFVPWQTYTAKPEVTA
jgi:hypothetical protein